MAPKRTRSPSLTSNTPTKRQKRHHPTDSTNKPEEDISPSLSEPEDALPRTTSHSSSPPQPVISLPSKDDEANDTDTELDHAINMTAIQAQSSNGTSIPEPVSSEKPCPAARGGLPTWRRHWATTSMPNDGNDIAQLSSRPEPYRPQHRPFPLFRFVDVYDTKLQENSDLSGTPLRPNFQLRSLPEAIGPLENHSATEHDQPLSGRRPNSSTSGGSANQYNPTVAPRLPSSAPSEVLESRKHNVALPESLSLHHEPTHVHSLFSPSWDPLPGATASSQSPIRPASICTSRITLPDRPHERPGRVDYELPCSGDETTRIAPPDEQRDLSPAAAPCSAPESPNQIVAFAESEPQGGSTNGIMWEALR